jgi:hypothetical protein
MASKGNGETQSRLGSRQRELAEIECRRKISAPIATFSQASTPRNARAFLAR